MSLAAPSTCRATRWTWVLDLHQGAEKVSFLTQANNQDGVGSDIVLGDWAIRFGDHHVVQPHSPLVDQAFGFRLACTSPNFNKELVYRSVPTQHGMWDVRSGCFGESFANHPGWQVDKRGLLLFR